MTADWLPVAALAGLFAVAYLRSWVKRFLKRRRTPPLAETLLERRVAVGALSGVLPADIEAHVLLVLEDGGRVVITGTGCSSLRGFMLAHAAAAHAAAAFQAHNHDEDHGGES